VPSSPLFCINYILRMIKRRARDNQLQKNKQLLLKLTVSLHQPLHHVKEGWIVQPLDHFNQQNSNTFPQRFFVNEAYWQHPDGPVFLYIGGEGPLVEYDVLTGHHSDMAEEHGALLLALEHRFYGDSINPDGQLSGILLHFIAKFNLMVKCQSCSCETFTAKHNMVLVQYRVLLSC
uniref:Peptidase S9 prolyl oligopeptidase catalytic domain-containing protein n=1 Tax=Pundamilia nyererei TaxID=303518 RepID=A0A3B4H5V4_9CICH